MGIRRLLRRKCSEACGGGGRVARRLQNELVASVIGGGGGVRVVEWKKWKLDPAAPA